MKIDFRIDHEDHLKLKQGETYRVESITHPVLPSFFLVKPELQLPDFVSLVREEGLDMDGTHGCVYTLMAENLGKGLLISSFLDLKSGMTILEKTLEIEVF